MKKIIVLFLFAIVCCKDKTNTLPENVILLQSFENFTLQECEVVKNKLLPIYPNLKILKPIPFPDESWNEPKTRRRADYLLNYLNQIPTKNQLVIGLTHKDISTTKGNKKDWGIFGLANCPGSACIASDFRLKGKTSEKLFKVAIHELGHTQGLRHCPVKNCFMRNAEGKDHLDEETEFCKICKENLIKKGWKLK